MSLSLLLCGNHCARCWGKRRGRSRASCPPPPAPPRALVGPLGTQLSSFMSLHGLQPLPILLLCPISPLLLPCNLWLQGHEAAYSPVLRLPLTPIPATIFLASKLWSPCLANRCPHTSPAPSQQQLIPTCCSLGTRHGYKSFIFVTPCSSLEQPKR